MLAETIRQLTKIKKKYGGDIPVLYVYGDHTEMSMVKLEQTILVYVKKELLEKSFISSKDYNESDFLKECLYDPEKHLDYLPAVLITEKL